jgi:site-specific recombinase XerD
MTQISPLRRRMTEDMTVRNLSLATRRSYVHAVARFRRFFGRSPAKLGLEDVRAFQVHLAAGGVSWPALNQTVCALRRLARPEHWLFSGRDGAHPISPTALHAACRSACTASGLSKRVTVHTLRHSFATHLLESGTGIRVIQPLLGPGSLNTTARYTEVATSTIRDTPSPLDRLRLEVAPPA